MNSYKFYKITRKAIDLYVNGLLNERSLESIIKEIKIEDSYTNEDILEETQLIKELFNLRKYYEIESFCEEFIAYITLMPYKIKGDITLIIGALESISEKLNTRIYSQMDIHIYKLLSLNYMYKLSSEKIKLILDNSYYLDDVLGINLVESYSDTYEQYGLFDTFLTSNKNNEARESLSRNNETTKSNIQENINSLITEYYDAKTLKLFIESFNNLFDDTAISTEKKKKIFYLFNLKMQYYSKQARINWEKKSKKAKKDIKTYTLPLNFK